MSLNKDLEEMNAVALVLKYFFNKIGPEIGNNNIFDYITNKLDKIWDIPKNKLLYNIYLFVER